MLATRLLNHCERFYGHIETVNKKTVNDVKFMVPIDKNGDKIQYDLKAETFVASRKPIMPFNESCENEAVPEIYPLDQIVSIPKLETDFQRISSYREYKNWPFNYISFFKKKKHFPTAIKSSHSFSHPHTILLHYSRIDVKNLFEEPVTDDQFESRAILKGFAAAASRAQSLYGVIKSLNLLFCFKVY